MYQENCAFTKERQPFRPGEAHAAFRFLLFSFRLRTVIPRTVLLTQCKVTREVDARATTT